MQADGGPLDLAVLVGTRPSRSPQPSQALGKLCLHMQGLGGWRALRGAQPPRTWPGRVGVRRAGHVRCQLSWAAWLGPSHVLGVCHGLVVEG